MVCPLLFLPNAAEALTPLLMTNPNCAEAVLLRVIGFIDVEKCDGHRCLTFEFSGR